MLTCVDFSTVDDIHCVHKAVEILESKVEMLVEQFAPLKIQRAFKPEKQPLFEVSSTSKLSHLKTDAFQKFIDTGLDKTSTAWDDYCWIHNKASHVVRDAKTWAMRAVLNDKTLDQLQKNQYLPG